MARKNENHIEDQKQLIVLAVIMELANGARETDCINFVINIQKNKLKGGDFMGNNSAKGYIILPCFTVEMKSNCEFEMTCNNFLGWVFETFFAPFWSGKITITEQT